MIDEVRKEFEAWLIKHQRDKGYGSLIKDDDFLKMTDSGEYRSGLFEHMWESYQHQQQKIDALRGALEKYGDHSEGCEAESLWLIPKEKRTYRKECTCGFSKALEVK